VCEDTSKVVPKHYAMKTYGGVDVRTLVRQDMGSTEEAGQDSQAEATP
jgi:hypothetical protein